MNRFKFVVTVEQLIDSYKIIIPIPRKRVLIYTRVENVSWSPLNQFWKYNIAK